MNDALETDSRPAPTQADRAPSCTLVIFGATGDLTRRLLVPALYNLARWKLAPDDFKVIGIGRTEQDAQAFRDGLTAALRGDTTGGGKFAADGFDDAAWQGLAAAMDYLSGDLRDPGTYEKLGELIAASGGRRRNVLFYLAVAPDLFGPVIKQVSAAGLARQDDGSWRRVIIEKPFGRDLESARALNREILDVLAEDQIYRIDHFLGKETVQNIMAFRFGNGLFEPIWNRDHIDHVQITVAETVGVETRGRFYEATGALRDMVPNHLFQLLTMTAMEPPNSFDADAVRNRKQDVLSAVQSLTGADVPAAVVRAQYTAGSVAGTPVRSYREEPEVAPDSSTETYVAMRLMIDNWRWAGVPFYLRTGKAMTRRDTEIAIRFKQAPLALFRGTAVEQCIPNWLVIQIQPDEGISLQFGAKVPGPKVRLGPVQMSFSYADHFSAPPSTGYETLIYDAMIGDPTLYQRADAIEAGWQIVQPILDAWSERAAPLTFYEAGTAGPNEADRLIGGDGRSWRAL
jgi:glucose-6-phosphate 1-dehydrogenase